MFHIQFFILSLSSIGIVLTQEAQAEHQLKRNGRLFKHDWEVEPHQFPAMVSLQIDNTHYCGGTLIDSTVVLTAAQCLPPDGIATGYSVTVLLGAHNLSAHSENELRSNVSEFIRHPEFNPESMEHDVGLIILEKPVQQVPGKIQFAEIPVYLTKLRIDRTWLIAVGWGRTQEKGPPSTVLRESLVTDAPIRLCRKVYPGKFKRSSMLCLDTISGGGVEVCQGDAGDPVFLAYDDSQGIQIGIRSFGPSCAQHGKFPVVYTSVLEYGFWIFNYDMFRHPAARRP